MATLTPTLTLTSTDATTDQLAFSVTDSLSISKKVIGLSKVQLSTSDFVILAASSYTKSYIYMKNTDDSIVMTIQFGGNTAFFIGPGEFTFFPWSGGGDINATSASGTPYLEYALFEA
tara:strand:- start:127 stop:480 length:354 start_codon:yes stop_codon:yes gene_type:complete